MAKLLHAYKDKLLTFARLLENATALVVSNTQARSVSDSALPALCSPHQQFLRQDQLSTVSVSCVLSDSWVR